MHKILIVPHQEPYITSICIKNEHISVRSPDMAILARFVTFALRIQITLFDTL